jgi:hypothetical protein
MGISEHFEEIFRLPSFSGAGDSDYLYMPGAAAIEQAGGSWGLLRAYARPRPDVPKLRPLPQNLEPATATICPTNAPQRKYTVVALTVRQALGGPLVYNSRGPGISDPNAILYFQLQDLDCPGGQPSASCKARLEMKGNPQPLVLRANAGDCMNVTLYNMIQGDLGAGASAPVPICLEATTSDQESCPSATSTTVGLHPQLVSFDVRTSNGFNAGNNPDQLVAADSKDPRTYVWYAGNIDEKAPAGERHIPIEFGAANLLPSDSINQFQYGLFGALVIEPQGSTCLVDGQELLIESCRGTSALIESPSGRFREHVLITQDGLQGPTGSGSNPFALNTAFLGGDNFNAVNYRSEPLVLAGVSSGNPGVNARSCDDPNDFSCVLSSAKARCCTAFDSQSATCTTTVPCGGPQTPIFTACPGEQVRFRVLQPGGINTNNVFELYGHSWQEQPYMSSGKGCQPATTQTNLYASSRIGTENGCNLLEQDTYSEYQGSRMGHGPTNHFDVLIPSAGGAAKVPGDYLYRSYPASHYRLGLWGIFRVTPAACGTGGGGGGAVAAVSGTVPPASTPSPEGSGLPRP